MVAWHVVYMQQQLSLHTHTLVGILLFRKLNPERGLGWCKVTHFFRWKVRAGGEGPIVCRFGELKTQQRLELMSLHRVGRGTNHVHAGTEVGK